MKKIQVHIIDANALPNNNLFGSSFLNDDDLKQIEKYKVESMRKEKAVSLILKRKYIGEYHLNSHGKPIADNNTCFNISHTHGVVAFVMDELPIGVDIELIKEVEEKFKEYIATEEELEYIKTEEDFHDIWTNKESLVKAVGTGIERSVKDIPGLPINGLREYKGKKYYSRTVRFRYYAVTVTREDPEEFDIELIQEEI